jgi:hypothetical protein
VYCPACEIDFPEGANFCSSCGRPLHRGAVGALPSRLRWEYKELVIPLEASSRVFWEFPQESRARFAEVVGEHLTRAGLEGWQADEAIDFDSLKAAGRLEETRHRRFGHVTVYSSVSVRLKRVVQA